VVAERGTTVAVLGGGHGRLYPRAHRQLADVIVDAGGALVSELPPDSGPTRGTFPRRNRLISGLADATVVVEATAESGALITAGWALEQGRPCFVVPGAIGEPTSAGCLALLRDYPDLTRIVAGVPELLEDLGLARREEAETTRRAGAAPRSSGSRPGRAGVLAELGAGERSVAEALLAGRTTADELVAATKLPVAGVLGILTLLELRGLVSAAYGRYRPAGTLASR
jgi:DNA processing protein